MVMYCHLTEVIQSEKMKIQIKFLVVLVIHFCWVNGEELPDGFCRGINTGMFPHPDNCFQFIICVAEAASIYTCPVTTPVFNYTRCVEGKFNFFWFIDFFVKIAFCSQVMLKVV